MEPITIATISAFLGACLWKAGEKISEKAIETAFEHKSELAEKFTTLFKQEIITLGLTDSTTPQEIQKQLESSPEVALQALKKLEDNPKLVADLNNELTKKINGISINAEKIGQVVNKMEGTITQTFNL